MLLPGLYDASWRCVRAKRNKPALFDESLWHQVFGEYLNSLPPVKPGDEIIEQHLRILGPIAGKIAWKRCPKSFGIWTKECTPSLSHVGLVHELAAFGVFGLFIAADRYDPKTGRAFSTYANFWIKKFVRLYLEEIIGIVPRTGHKDGGDRVSVLDRVNAALEGRRLYRGKASGGMATFDGAITIAGPNEGDKEIATVDANGRPTDPTSLDYLQRHVGKKLWPWHDMGTYFVPRLELPGHGNGMASADPPREVTYRLDPVDQIELPANPAPIGHTGPSMKLGIMPAEICYLDKRCGSFNSRDTFGEVRSYKPEITPKRAISHWRNSYVFAVEYLRRHARKTWRKPSCEELCRCQFLNAA